MKSLILLLSLYYPSGETVLYKDLEVFKRLSSGTVAVNDTFIFLLDRKETTLTRISIAEGERRVVAKRGQGPGELTAAIYMQATKDRVFAFQIRGFAEFDHTGTFIKQHRRLDPRKGYICLDDGFLTLDLQNYKLLRFSEIGGSTSEFVAWQERRLYPELPEPQVFYPTWEIPRVQFNLSTQTAVIGHTGAYLSFSVVDLKTGERKQFKMPQVQAVDMNDDWLEQQRDRVSSNPNVKVSKEDKFPVIRDLWIAPGNIIVIETWSADVSQNRHFYVFNMDGTESSLDFEPQSVERIIHYNKDWIIFAAFTEDEESYLVRCSHASFPKEVKRHPWAEMSKQDGFVSLRPR